MARVPLHLCRSEGTFLITFGACGKPSNISSDILVPRKWSIDCKRNKDDLDLIKLELQNAKRIAKYGHDHIDDNSDDTKRFLLGFIPERLRNLPKNYIVEQLQQGYGNGADILGDSGKYAMKVTCDQETPKCKAGYYAHMRDKTKTMNICDAWFDPKGTPAETLETPAGKLETTEDILKGCKDKSGTRFNTLEDFWHGKGKLPVHDPPDKQGYSSSISTSLCSRGHTHQLLHWRRQVSTCRVCTLKSIDH